MPEILQANMLFAGRYELKEQLGVGGMGEVHLAWDREAERECALKLLPEVGYHASRFKREFRAASRLNHPNCIRVFDMGKVDRRWYYTMEYVRGARVIG